MHKWRIHYTITLKYVTVGGNIKPCSLLCILITYCFTHTFHVQYEVMFITCLERASFFLVNSYAIQWIALGSKPKNLTLWTLQEDMISNATIKITYGQRNTKHAQQPHGTVPLCRRYSNTVSGGNFSSEYWSQKVVQTYRDPPFHGLAKWIHGWDGYKDDPWSEAILVQLIIGRGVLLAHACCATIDRWMKIIKIKWKINKQIITKNAKILSLAWTL
jgi:hypothetical protein